MKNGFGISGLLALILTTMLLTSSAFAVTIRDDKPDNAYIALGNSPAYACVGSLVNGYVYTGSGVLISPDWVLTAAHLLLSAGSTTTFTIDGTTYNADQVIRNPNWDGAAVPATSDIGLVHLTTPVTSVTPALLYTGSSELNQVGTFVGYGFGGTGLTGADPSKIHKRGFNNVIDGDFNPLVYGCDFDRPGHPEDNWFGTATPLDLEGCVASGDSGGGVFINVNGQNYLAGIISEVLATDGNANSSYGDLSSFGRVSAFTSWIGGYVPVPEPSPFALALAGGLVLFTVRRRK